MRITWRASILVVLLSFGCHGKSIDTNLAGQGDENTWIEFSLSSPNHIDDWNQLRDRVKSEDIDCLEGPSSLGTLSLLVASDSFNKAKQIAVREIAENTLTIRIKKNAASELYEVYSQGKKINEESYSIGVDQ